MISPTAILIGTIVVSISIAGLVASKPSVTSTRGGKILAFVAILLFPVLSGSMGVDEHMERSKTTAFCRSCHVMENYGRSLRVDDASAVPAAHFQNNRVPRDKACYTCHTDYTLYGGFKSKLRGLRHLYVQYLGKIPEKVEFYNAYNNRECLHCHGGARSFGEGATHNLEDGRLDSIKSNPLSCSSTECHNIVHNVTGLKATKRRTKEIIKSDRHENAAARAKFGHASAFGTACRTGQSVMVPPDSLHLVPNAGRVVDGIGDLLYLFSLVSVAEPSTEGENNRQRL